ncbi:unnamed protein product [Aspergillus oryzae]|uniref:Unnamed protein product n=1 Tax=Aspergillus oryzae TaxID=5062 RepID=A0AAN4YEW1_ASPOZ|nr:unnamed protein product [Aspergillus oryzae]
MCAGQRCLPMETCAGQWSPRREFSVPVKVAVAANGVRSSQANGAVAVGTPPAKITDYKVSGANGLKHENGCISNDTQHLLQNLPTM